jgi:ParB-like nuclease domain
MSKSEFLMPTGIVANRTIMMTGNVEGMRSDIGPKKIIRVPINAIEIGERKRKPNAADVKRIYDDIANQGLLQPIGVKELGYSRYKLLYGYHRLEAFHMGLKGAEGAAVVDWETIPAVVYDMEMPAWAAELKEISENLFRKNLTQAEMEDHRTRYAAILKRNNLTVEGRKPKADANTHDASLENQKPSIFNKMEKDLGVSHDTVQRDFANVSKRAKAVARAEGKPEPKSIKPTSPAEDIEVAVQLSERHTAARKAVEAEGGDPRKKMPIQPQAFTVITVRIDCADPEQMVEWFKAKLADPNKPVTEDYVRKLARGLLKLIGD